MELLQFRPTENRAVTIHDQIASAHRMVIQPAAAGGVAAAVFFGLARAGSRCMTLSLAFLRSR